MNISDAPIPLFQSPEFARTSQALGTHVRTHRWTSSTDTHAVWQVQSRRFGPFGWVDLVSRGPVVRKPQLRLDWLQNWRDWHGGRPLVFNPVDTCARALRGAGFWPLMTPASLAILPLHPPQLLRSEMHPQWRTRLRRAEGKDIDVTRYPLKEKHWLLSAEKVQMKTRKYRGISPQFSVAFSELNPDLAQVFEAKCKGEVVAAIIVLRHGKMATWQIGHSTKRGRQVNAMNLLLWRAMEWLQSLGHTHLDLGIINEEDTPGLARFKLGTGACRERQSGTWLHCRPLAPIARQLPLWMAGVQCGVQGDTHDGPLEPGQNHPGTGTKKPPPAQARADNISFSRG